MRPTAVERANTAHIRQSRPDHGLVFQGKILRIFELFSLRSEVYPRVSVSDAPEEAVSEVELAVLEVERGRGVGLQPYQIPVHFRNRASKITTHMSRPQAFV